MLVKTPCLRPAGDPLWTKVPADGGSIVPRGQPTVPAIAMADPPSEVCTKAQQVEGNREPQHHEP
jgi:hypothetical protein